MKTTTATTAQGIYIDMPRYLIYGSTDRGIDI